MTDLPAQDIPVVAIIGGGFTGAVTAFHLGRAPTGPARIVVIEPRETLGQGLAYSTADPSHRINVPAARMTLDCARKSGLQDWLDAQGIPLSPGTRLPTGEAFVQRRLVANYVGDALAPLLASGRVRHLRASAVAAERAGGRFRVRCDDGSALAADLLVIATSHPPPGIPAVFADLARSPHLIPDSSDAARVAEVARTAPNVLVVGTGLTSADVIASLDRQGHAGRITALSRRGLRSRGHAIGYAESAADFAAAPSRTALGLLRRIRQAVRRDAQAGLPWQAALDNVRRDGPAIWAALPLAERARLLRWLRVWWDVHRFRIAPQVEAVLDRLIVEGRLTLAPGRLLSARQAEAGIDVTWRGRDLRPRSEVFNAVILTTGPAHGGILAGSPVLSSLAETGLIRADPLHLGLDVAQGCHAVGKGGTIQPDLLVAGPLARGHVGELMGIPEVTAHAQQVADRLAQLLGAREPVSGTA